MDGLPADGGAADSLYPAGLVQCAGVAGAGSPGGGGDVGRLSV